MRKDTHSPTTVDKAFPLLILTGMLGLSSALLTREALLSPNPAMISKSTTLQKKRSRPLCVLADFMDARVNPTTKNDSSNHNYLHGETVAGDNDDDNEDDNDDADGRSASDKNTLTFRSSFQRQSNPLEGLSDDVALDEFFLHPDHLLSAGESVGFRIVPSTPDLLEDWSEACDRVGASQPTAGESVVLSVRTAGISVPGLTVEWSALIGTSLVRHRPLCCSPGSDSNSGDEHRQQQHPELEFVLIRDENKVSSGAKPIVWIFNKVNRSKQKQKQKRKRKGPMATTLFTRLGVYRDNDGDGESLVLRCAGTMEMKFRIPSMVTNLVFSSDAEGSQKTRAERKISNLITQQIEKDTEQNVSRWEENFRSWMASADERNGDHTNNEITTTH